MYICVHPYFVDVILGWVIDTNSHSKYARSCYTNTGRIEYYYFVDVLQVNEMMERTPHEEKFYLYFIIFKQERLHNYNSTACARNNRAVDPKFDYLGK